MLKISSFDFDRINYIDDLRNYTHSENISICKFLYFFDISDIAKEVAVVPQVGE